MYNCTCLPCMSFFVLDNSTHYHRLHVFVIFLLGVYLCYSHLIHLFEKRELREAMFSCKFVYVCECVFFVIFPSCFEIISSLTSYIINPFKAFLFFHFPFLYSFLSFHPFHSHTAKFQGGHNIFGQAQEVFFYLMKSELHDILTHYASSLVKKCMTRDRAKV